MLRQVHQFQYDKQMTQLQSYYFRAASVHQNVHLSYFLNEEGQESTDVLSPNELKLDLGLNELPDIRDCSAHRAFVRLIGGDLDLRQNGYKELSKEQRSELKFAAGNLMQH